MDLYPDAGERNILLFGTGKIGRNTCENLVKHTRNDHITLINRTLAKAEEVAGKFNLIVRPISSLEAEIAKADIIVVATGAQQPTVLPQHLNGDKKRLLLDLSIPRNVAPEVGELEHADLVHLDQLAQMADSTIRERANHIPDAEKIIEAVKSDFNAWASSRRFAPAIAALKNKLSSIKEGEIDNQRRKLQDFDTRQAEIISDRIIHKITTQVVNHLKNSNGSSDTSLEVIRKIFELDTH
jgi:glutamyl-tRNA reductase